MHHDQQTHRGGITNEEKKTTGAITHPIGIVALTTTMVYAMYMGQPPPLSATGYFIKGEKDPMDDPHGRITWKACRST